MPKGVSVHLGVDYVSKDHYGSWHQLPYCSNDAAAMKYIAQSNGFETYSFLNEEATSQNLFFLLSQAAEDLQADDILFISFSGHGTLLQDLNGDERDGRDEAICLYNRQVVDDELYLQWTGFRPGVRILFISDSCHSGSITKHPDTNRSFDKSGISNMRIQPAGEVYLKNQWQYDAILKNIIPHPKTEIASSVLLLSACQEMESARAGMGSEAQLSPFTEILMHCWSDGSFDRSYKDFHELICHEMRVRKIPQTPNYNIIGPDHPLFHEKCPFII